MIKNLLSRWLRRLARRLRPAHLGMVSGSANVLFV
jgi:hypothetical protein